MKGTYKLSCDLEEKETYGIVKTGPGQFEVCINPFLKGNESWENPPYIEDYTMTSSILDKYNLPSGIDLSAAWT